MRLILSSGEVLEGALHASFVHGEARRLCGRTLDLDAAYKQLLVAKSSLWTSVLAVENPQAQKQLFVAQALPFGASASVYGFNRCARALHGIGEQLFGLIWGNYFDDYPQLDLAVCGNDAQQAAERLFDMLGWQYSVKEAKRPPMRPCFDALGVTFDLSRSALGDVVVRNKVSRVLAISDEINAILACNSLPSRQALALRGRLQFAETHTFGRVLAGCHRSG